MRLWASLIGPLHGAYYPCPDTLEGELEFRVALNNSKLARLWCAVYTEEEVDRMIAEHNVGEFKLPVHVAAFLDYDSYEVDMVRRRAHGSGD